MEQRIEAGISRTRALLLEDVADSICSITLPHPVRVGIDGVDGAGKTTFADELAQVLKNRRVEVIRASIDSFHNPRAVRYMKGKNSPEGFYRDSFDITSLRTLLLDALGPEGDGAYVPAIFDHRTDSPVELEMKRALTSAVLVFDGIFLHQPNIRDAWDYSIFLDVDFEHSVARMAGRDGSSPEVNHPSNARYVEGQKIYITECSPCTLASITVDNRELNSPRIIRASVDRN